MDFYFDSDLDALSLVCDALWRFIKNSRLILVVQRPPKSILELWLEANDKRPSKKIDSFHNFAQNRVWWGYLGRCTVLFLCIYASRKAVEQQK